MGRRMLTACLCPVPESVNEYPGIIRFHVIANSNSQKDQNIKYMVRNHVFCKLENQLTAAMLQAEDPGCGSRCGGRHRKASGAHSLRISCLAGAHCANSPRGRPQRNTRSDQPAPISKPTCLRSRRGRRTACAPPGVAIRRAHSMASAPIPGKKL